MSTMGATPGEQVDHTGASPRGPRSLCGLDVPGVRMDSCVAHPDVGAGDLLGASEDLIDLAQQRIERRHPPVLRIEVSRGHGLERRLEPQLGLLGDACDEAVSARALGAGEAGPQGVRDEPKQAPLRLVALRQPEEQSLLEGALEVEVSDLGVMGLPEAVDAAVALLEPVGVVGEFQVYEVMAALVEVETLGARVGGHEEEVVGLREARRDALARVVVVLPGEREDLPAQVSPLLRSLEDRDGGRLAIDVLSVDQHVRGGLTLPDGAHRLDEDAQLGVLGVSVARECREEAHRIAGALRSPGVVTRAQGPAGERGELGLEVVEFRAGEACGELVGFDLGLVALLLGGEGTEAGGATVHVAQAADALLPGLCWFDATTRHVVEALGDHVEG